MPDDAFKKFELSFSKLEKARFFGHLELATIFNRAIKRAGLVAKYSQGFNPLMQLSFDNALPVGMESEEEILFIYLEKDMAPNTIIDCLNKTLPEGLCITGCKTFNRLKGKNTDTSSYIIKFSDFCLEKERVAAFLSLPEFIVQDLSKKQKIRSTDLRKAVKNISFIDLQTIKMVLQKYNERNVRPTEILTKYFNLDEDLIKKARIKKIT